MTASVIPLPLQVRQTRDRLVGLLRELDPKAGEWVEQVRNSRPQTPSVVVVGETKRGKSSLVNALLATPGLSPVDADVATATYLVLRQGHDWAARACYPGQIEPVPFELAQLPNWVSMTHELPAGQLPPRYVEVDAPIPLLERLTVVDTPGVGGLDSVHGELAAEAAATATALLFVVDASSPFTRGELTFLRNVGERVETVLFAVTKVDQYRGWRQVAEADRALLAEHAPRFGGADFHPVSARMMEFAAKAPNPDAAAALRQRSGIAQLQTALQETISGRAAMLGEANTLRALSTALGGLTARLEGEARALSTGEDEAQSLRSRRDELRNERRSSTRNWSLRLRGEIQRARSEVGHEIGKQIRDAQSWFRHAIDHADREALAQLPQQVDAALQLISARVSQGLTRRLSQVSEAALAELFSPSELDMIRAQFAQGGQPPVTLRPPDKRKPNAEDKLLVFMGMSGGLGLGRGVAALAGVGAGAAVGTLSLVVLPATIVLGLGAGWWMARTRKHAADRQHMMQWLVEAIAEGRSTLDHLISDQMIQAEQQLSIALDDAMAKRLAAIEDELRDVDKALRMDAEERSRELTAVTKRLAEVKAGRQHSEQLLERIRELRDTH
jgi:tRNA U34 5-carboxymethylaminomethyl modifying GTPase MnmE/TrmE